MSMGTSRVRCQAVILPLLFTSLARAEPPASAPPAVVGAAPATAVAIEIHGAQPNLQLEVQDPKTRRPLALCAGDCQATIMPGRYRLFVNATADTRPGGREVLIAEPSRLLITPRSEARYATGLVLGIAGPVLMVLGSVVLLNNAFDSIDSDGNSRRSADATMTGALMVLGGIVITPIGWIMFGTSLRPSVDVTPLPR
jgi:hypothetical protein